MRRVFGPRTIVEAAFLVAVPVVALEVGAQWPAIVGASAVAYLLVLAVEATLWREGALRPSGAATQVPRRHTLRVRKAEPRTDAPAGDPGPLQPGPVEPVPVQPAPVQPVPVEIAPDVEAPAIVPVPVEHVRVLRPDPPPEPQPVIERAPLVAVPAPEPEPEPEREPERDAVPVGAAVVPIGVGSSPRRWNLWDLERLTREHAGGDAGRHEERTFLLMYLREFADADGLLPVDFDGLVRDTFGELVGAR